MIARRLDTIHRHDLLEIFSRALTPGDCVLVHSSFSSLGHVDGGADTLIDVLLEIVGIEGTIIMPTATTSFSRTGFFDVIRSPSETGLLSEVFRNRQGVRRSCCPMASFAASGRHAARFTRRFDSFLDDESPLMALLELDGKIVLYGVGYDKCTVFHLSEERRKANYNGYREFSGTVVDAVGREGPGSQTYFVRKSLEIRKDPRPACEAFDRSADVFVENVNDGQIRIFRARRFDEYCMQVLDRNERAFLVDDPIGDNK